jgi:hypothetical protein
MQEEPQRPYSLVFCSAMIRLAAQLVPAPQREAWRQLSLAAIWHRWQFLLHAGEWNDREAFRLFWSSLAAFKNAVWDSGSREALQNRIRECARSPWTCFAVWIALLLATVAISGGVPATRQLLSREPQQGSGKLLFVWLHPFLGGGDRGLPSDVVPAWTAHDHLLENEAPFSFAHRTLGAAGIAPSKWFVITTEPRLFSVLGARPQFGAWPQSSAVVLDHQTWVSRFHANPRVVGSAVQVGGETYRVAAVLPASFRFLSRQPAVYVVEPNLSSGRVMLVARAKPGTSESKLRAELTKIAENSTYYFFNSTLRVGFLETALLTPVRFFCIAVLLSTLLILIVCRVRVRRLRIAFDAQHCRATARRVLFFLGKATLALAFVFIAGLESSRSQSAVLLGSRDPASGPFLVWLYIVGTMGVLFWSLADQRARCRVCLRLLCFPVRIGCPGCLLLEWSGTELLCTEGHGVLHVPLLAPSWDEESEHWISMDESWRGLFVDRN